MHETVRFSRARKVMCVVIKLTVHMEPVAKQRARTGRGFAYTPQKTARFEKDLAMRVGYSLPGFKPFSGPLRLSVRFIFTPPRKQTRPYPCKSDIDNLQKAFCDALNGVLWVDDVQIIDSKAVKLYAMDGSPSRIEFEVEELAF